MSIAACGGALGGTREARTVGCVLQHPDKGVAVARVLLEIIVGEALSVVGGSLGHVGVRVEVVAPAVEDGKPQLLLKGVYGLHKPA